MARKSRTKALKDQLDKMGIQYPPRATIPVLEAILEDNTGASPVPETEAELEALDVVDPPPEPSAEPLIQGEHGPVIETGDEGCPPMDPALGDKTPAVVEWRRENWSKGKFMRQYAGRKIEG